MESAIPDNISVAVRVRPLIASEKSRGCADIIQVSSNINQINITTCDKTFTFNHAFKQTASHEEFYTSCIKPIIGNLFKGYNCTVLAYGQTGSGKTYTMGTTFSVGEEEMGVIPRAISDLYKFVNDNFSYDFVIKVSFMELYKEVLYDLLNDKERSESTLEIREDGKNIVIPYLTEITVSSAADILKLLSKGSHGRATGKTNMNAQSSRSHAIFTISIAMTDKKNPSICKTSKFHLVDLAGSERAGKTGATGETFDEGVNINKGLLALGNVISALGDDKQKNLGFIPYRNSSLTRLLKDSLGGNSITIMIACVSPADYNMDETLSTLRYADRARKIKNKPVINQDPHAAELNRLQKLVDHLRLELAGQGGPTMSPRELEQLGIEKQQLKATVSKMSSQISNVISRNTMLQEHVLLLQTTNERMQDKIKDVYNITLTEMNEHIEACNIDGIKHEFAKLKNLHCHLNEIGAEQKNAETEMQTQDHFMGAIHSQTTGDATLGDLEEQQQHASNQIHMHEELEVVMKQLAHKEYLARKVALSAEFTIDIQAKAEDEAKIAALEAERDQLVVQLDRAKSAKINVISAEQRKRMQELEVRISELKKRVQEQSRRLSMKKRDEERIVRLNEEIRVMKLTKVQLIRNMKSEADNYRKEKLRREQEMTKLRDQDRKRQNQMVRMESLHNRQHKVLKRQMEEAAAVNKRLKASLALRKNVQEHKASTGKIERLTQWVKNEIDVIVNSTQARSTLTSLMESRALLQKQIDDLDKSANENLIRQLEDDINLRSLQIKDIQQKLMDSDDSKSKINWDYVQTMSEAKHAIKMLFETVPDVLKDLQQKVNDANVNSNNPELESRIVEVEDENLRLKNQLQRFMETQDTLQRDKSAKEGQEDARAALNSTITINIIPPSDCEQKVVPEVHTPVNVKVKYDDARFKSPFPVESPLLSTDDEEKDPDWRNTPLAKRISRMQRSTAAAGVKKRSNQGGCMCKSSCSSRCGCMRAGTNCSSSCRCIETCNNRFKENDEFVENIVKTENDIKTEVEKDNNVTFGANYMNKKMVFKRKAHWLNSF